ncbi:MAG: DUF1810 family protein, partial [Acidobacteriaceae bacterium]|nr:DUF1810 family protein [Acidobacteriaceae bacterium]
EGLGYSVTAQRYAIRSRAEAEAYSKHELLGAALKECTRLILAIKHKSARQIFGTPDDLKFCSSMTLFDAVGAGDLFREALARYYEGQRDERTLRPVNRWSH